MIIGVSCEVKFSSLSVYDIISNDDNANVNIIAKGVYRFKIIDVRKQNNINIGTVKFFFDNDDHRKKVYYKDRNPFPNWVYEKYSMEALCSQAWLLYSKMMLLTDDETESNPNMLDLHKNSASLSYYLASNLPLDNNVRLSLLNCDNTADRLFSCIQILESSQDQVLQCLVCSQTLANLSSVFTVPGAEGNIGAYINPGGIVHQTVTLRHLVRGVKVKLHGKPEPRDSWFPGYAWTITCCNLCSTHLGWYFTPVDNNSKVKFFGLRRAALKKVTNNPREFRRGLIYRIMQNFNLRSINDDENNNSNDNYQPNSHRLAILSQYIFSINDRLINNGDNEVDHMEYIDNNDDNNFSGNENNNDDGNDNDNYDDDNDDDDDDNDYDNYSYNEAKEHGFHYEEREMINFYRDYDSENHDHNNNDDDDDDDDDNDDDDDDGDVDYFSANDINDEMLNDEEG